MRGVVKALISMGVFAAVTGCSQTDTNKAAQSVATSAPVLAAGDALLAIAVKARLAAADIDSTTGVGVSAHGGTVVLGGSVRSKSEISTLRDAARSVSGVKAVRSELRVDHSKPTASDQAGDLALAARVMAGIAGQTGLNALSVHAAAKNGVVTLAGSARNAAIKATTLEAARKTPGVRTVVDRLKIT